MIEFVECTDNNTCDENALCSNVTGTRVCTCNEGFTGNGTVCEGRYSAHIFIIWILLCSSAISSLVYSFYSGMYHAI